VTPFFIGRVTASNCCAKSSGVRYKKDGSTEIECRHAADEEWRHGTGTEAREEPVEEQFGDGARESDEMPKRPLSR
jgi:hypothetical protein